MTNLRRINWNEFYRLHYQKIILALIVMICVLILMVSLVLYQLLTRPLPRFVASTPKNKILAILPNDEPSLLSTTLIQWASKAAVSAYTFDFVNYNAQIAAVRPYFTDAGWADYQASISGLLQTIAANQLFVYGVVSEPPVISNQGDVSSRGYVWRVQMPFLVTYQSASEVKRQSFIVVVTIVKVSTNDNPAGIGIDQFQML